MQFYDFDLLVRRLGDEFEAHVIRSPGGESRHRFATPFSPIQLENLLLRLGRVRGRRGGFDTDGIRAAKQFGGQLYAAVFGGSVGACLETSIQKARAAEACVRIRLRIEAPDFADVPWEYLYDASQNRFLALSATTSLVRYLELPHASRPAKIGDGIRVVAVISSPKEYPELDTEQEWTKLQNAFRNLPSVEIERVAPTVGALQACLRGGRTHIFHFIGHGDFDERAGDGLVVFEDQNGNADAIPSSKLAVILHNHPDLRLAVLNCCEGARSGAGQPFSGVGPALVQQGLPAVVAMQFAIADTAAITFAGTFYECLAGGLPIDRALVEARTAMFVEEDESFGAPVLYMRSDEGVLFDPVRRIPPAPAPVLPHSPPPLPPPNKPRDRAIFKWAPSAFFGIVWMAASLFSISAMWNMQVLEHDSFGGSVFGWSRFVIVLSALHALLFQFVRRRSQSIAASSMANVLSWIFWTGLSCTLAAAVGWVLSWLRSPPAVLPFQYWLVSAAFVLIYALMIRPHLDPIPRAIAIGTMIGIAIAFGLAMVTRLTGVGSSIAILFVVQGMTLHRSTSMAAATTTVSRAKIAFQFAAVLLLLFVVIKKPDPPAPQPTAADTAAAAAAAAASGDLTSSPTVDEVRTMGSIEGIVRGANNQPQLGATISISDGTGFGPDQSTVSQADGYYSLGLVTPGKYEVRINVPGHVWRFADNVVVSPGSTSIVSARVAGDERSGIDWNGATRPLLAASFRKLDLSPIAMRGALRGTVLGPSRAPVVGARVSAVDLGVKGSHRDTVTASNGSFSFPGLLWGDYYMVSAEHDTLGRFIVSEVSVNPGKVSLVSITLGNPASETYVDWTPIMRDMTEEEKRARAQ
jgi:hypothetical protein